MNFKKIKEFLEENGEPKFRLKQIQKAVYQDGVSSFDEISTLSKELRHRMSKLKILSFEVEKVLVAKDGQSIKALLRLNNYHSEHGRAESKNLNNNKIRSLDKLGMTKNCHIETVLISPKPGDWSVCVSCQVGCPMNCRFCATGRGGFQRNLTAEEITDQVLFWRQTLTRRFAPPSPKTGRGEILSNIVYMGMGEPFLNWENVRESLKNLINPELFGFGSRSISVSTAGIPDGIAKLAGEFPQVNLAVSLHFADDKKRSEFMPVNKKYNLEDLKKALQNYFQKTNRKVFLEYILLDNINDSREDANKLVKYLKSIGKLQLLHINLIRYNTTGEELRPSSKNKAEEFKNFLIKNRIQVTIRKSLGEEIQGACGQLAGK